MAYAHVATAEIILCEGSKTLETDGRPIKKNAMAKKNHGAVRIQTDGFSLNKAYQTADAARKIPPRMYNAQDCCQFVPDKSVIWKLVALSICPIAIIIVYRGQPPISRCMRICKEDMVGSCELFGSGPLYSSRLNELANAGATRMGVSIWVPAILVQMLTSRPGIIRRWCAPGGVTVRTKADGTRNFVFFDFLEEGFLAFRQELLDREVAFRVIWCQHLQLRYELSCYVSVCVREL